MGSYGGIRFDDLSICDSKSYIPDHWAVLFSETDRRSETELHKNAEPDEKLHPVIWYETDRETFLSRLSLLGATEAAMKHVFDAWLAEQQKDWDHYADEWKDQAGERAGELQTALKSLNFESWKSHANQTLRTRYNLKAPYKSSNALEEKFHDYDESYLHIAGFGELVTIRALLEACPEVTSIKLDVSDLINSGYYDETIEICTKARRDLPFSQLLGPTIILGEGSTDLLVLKRGLGSDVSSSYRLLFLFQPRRVQRRWWCHLAAVSQQRPLSPINATLSEWRSMHVMWKGLQRISF